MRRIADGIILFSGLLACGCAAVILGAGAGTGAAVYQQAKVTQTYDAQYRPSIRACLEALDSLDMPVTEKTVDDLKANISARRADGTPVSVEVVRAGPARTEVSVRTGVFGITEIETSRRVHERIESRLAAMAAAGSRAPEGSGPRPAPEAVESRPAQKQGQPSPARKAPSAPGSLPAKGRPPGVVVYFGADSNELRPDEIAKLNAFVALHRNRPELKLNLAGYPDSSGADEYNRMLSESRASTVKMYLVGKGFDPGRIGISGHGARGLPAWSADGQARRPERCVEVHIEGD
jgi:outer membrane protein OmpA-like peptidoglycan-associated protein